MDPMRLARLLIGLVYGSGLAMTVLVLTAPAWRARDGDLGFGFLMAGLFAGWLWLALVVALVALLAVVWGLASGDRGVRRRDMAVGAAAALAVIVIGGYAYLFFHW